MLPMNFGRTSAHRGAVMAVTTGPRATSRPMRRPRRTLAACRQHLTVLDRIAARPSLRRVTQALVQRCRSRPGPFGYRVSEPSTLTGAAPRAPSTGESTWTGGDFGTRNSCYPEFALVAWAARRLGRPVEWTGQRHEGFLADYQGRDLAARGRRDDAGARRRGERDRRRARRAGRGAHRDAGDARARLAGDPARAAILNSTKTCSTWGSGDRRDLTGPVHERAFRVQRAPSSVPLRLRGQGKPQRLRRPRMVSPRKSRRRSACFSRMATQTSTRASGRPSARRAAGRRRARPPVSSPGGGETPCPPMNFARDFGCSSAVPTT